MVEVLTSGLWSVFTLGGAGSKPGLEQEQNPLPLSNQSLLLLLVLANLTDGPNDCPNPYRQAVVPILEILYHVEDRNSHHVYMALIILLILTEDDTFNRSIHEVVSTDPDP
ncbi:unnamed protein product [Coregonus sp. 'balchen']|nr:unnamed protein product [Coregonus sp. 'balchen']